MKQSRFWILEKQEGVQAVGRELSDVAWSVRVGSYDHLQCDVTCLCAR